MCKIFAKSVLPQQLLPFKIGWVLFEGAYHFSVAWALNQRLSSNDSDRSLLKVQR
jgi:hypothetical protein